MEEHVTCYLLQGHDQTLSIYVQSGPDLFNHRAVRKNELSVEMKALSLFFSYQTATSNQCNSET